MTEASDRLRQLEEDLLSLARLWTVDVIAPATYKSAELPLARLLALLQDMKRETAHLHGTSGVTPACAQARVDMALDLVEQVRGIVAAMGVAFQAQAPGGPSSQPSGGRPGPAGRRLLTPREQEVLNLIAEGSSNKVGGHRLGISTRTFEVHRARIMAKLGARNAADLVRMSLTGKSGPDGRGPDS